MIGSQNIYLIIKNNQLACEQKNLKKRKSNNIFYSFEKKQSLFATMLAVLMFDQITHLVCIDCNVNKVMGAGVYCETCRTSQPLPQTKYYCVACNETTSSLGGMFCDSCFRDRIMSAHWALYICARPACMRLSDDQRAMCKPCAALRDGVAQYCNTLECVNLTTLRRDWCAECSWSVKK